MKRSIAFTLLIVLCIGLFTGCSKKEKAAGTPDDVPASQTDAVEKEPRSTLRFPEKDRYHYDMELTLDNRNQTVGGHVVFDFYNDSEDAWDKLCLRAYPSLYTDPDNLGYDEDSMRRRRIMHKRKALLLIDPRTADFKMPEFSFCA